MGVQDIAYIKNIQEAVVEVDSSTPTPSDVMTFSNGVQLKLKKVNFLRIQAVMNRFKYPEIPEYWDESRQRGIKNPDHPEYLRQKAEIDNARMWAVVDAIAALGTEVVFVPDSVPKLEDQNWIDECEFLGIPIVYDKPIARYLSWIKFVALTEMDDLNKLANEFGVVMGISGENVASAIEGFRSN